MVTTLCRMSSSGQSVRLFFGIWPGYTASAQLAELQGRWDWPPDASVYSPAKLHMTLHFLGNLPVDLVPRLGVAAHSIRFRPFDLELVKAGTWREANVAWVSPAPSEPLMALHDELGRALERIDVQIESRCYAPHLTLARKAGHATPPAEFEPIPWRVTNFVLARSVPGGQPAYQPLMVFPAR